MKDKSSRDIAFEQLSAAETKIAQLQAKLAESQRQENAAQTHIEQLQAELKAAIQWHHLPEVPKPDSVAVWIWVEAAIMHSRGKADEWQEMKELCYHKPENVWFFYRVIEKVKVDPLNIAGWYYEPTEAPPKPEAEPAIELSEPH